MTYDIIACHSQSDLRDKVQRAMERGAICNGGPFYDPKSEHWCQAVTLYDDGDLKSPDSVKLREPKRK